MDQSFRPSAAFECLQARAELYGIIRAFFQSRNVLEVEVPALASTFVSDPHIAPIIAEHNGASYYLQSSPEYFLKRLLSVYPQGVYSLAKAFRHSEQGRRHNPEFTLLEWYRLGFDDHQLMDEIVILLKSILPGFSVKKITYRQWFYDEFNIDPHQATDAEIEALAIRHITIKSSQMFRNDWLDLLITHILEPKLPKGLVFIFDYPESQAALARVLPDETGQPVARRFEAFLGGMELANGYWELSDAAEQAKRFDQDLQVKSALGLPIYPLDQKLLAALDNNFPDCAGVALGVDRLLMIMLNVDHIKDVLAFDFSRI